MAVIELHHTESTVGLGFGSLMEYNGLAYAWSGQTFKRHRGIRMSFSIMYRAHLARLIRVHGLSKSQGAAQASYGGPAV